MLASRTTHPAGPGQRGYTLLLTLFMLVSLTALGLAAITVSTGHLEAVNPRMPPLPRCADLTVRRMLSEMPNPLVLTGVEDVKTGYTGYYGHYSFAGDWNLGPRDTSGVTAMSGEFTNALVSNLGATGSQTMGGATFGDITNRSYSAVVAHTDPGTGGTTLTKETADANYVTLRLEARCVGPNGIEYESQAGVLYRRVGGS